MFKSSIHVFALLALFAFEAHNCFPTNEINDSEVIVKINSPDNIDKLKNLRQEELAEELSGQYQGDIIISAEHLRELESGKSGKTGLLNTRFHWVDAVVPYRVNESHFTQEQVAYIHLGARTMENVTCLKFVPYDPSVHEDFVTVMGTGSGCYSSVGRRGREQFLNLQPYAVETGCFRLYTIVHEFMHAVGFYHMQSATERDDFVRIVFESIQSGTENNFNTYSADVISNLGVEYDYGSVMHYSRTAFSKDGNDTIIALRPLNGQVMGQRLEMSQNDIARVNRMYCNETIETPTTTQIAPTTLNSTSIPETTTTTTSSRPNPIPVFVQTIHSFVNNLLSNILSSFKH